jgi:anti-sigma factor RsiW
MKCREARSLLGDYLADELSSNQRRALQAHLFQCAECRKELDELAAMQRQISESLHLRVLMESPPPQGWNRIKARLLEEVRQRSVTKLRSWFPGVVGGMGGWFWRSAWTSAIEQESAEATAPKEDAAGARAAIPEDVLWENVEIVEDIPENYLTEDGKLIPLS